MTYEIRNIDRAPFRLNGGFKIPSEGLKFTSKDKFDEACKHEQVAQLIAAKKLEAVAVS